MMKKVLDCLTGNKELKKGKKKVLYITANPKDVSQSYSLQVGQAFINEYRKLNPQDEIIEFDVYDIDIPLIDRDLLSAWDALSAGITFDLLTTEQKNKVTVFSQLTDQFVSADRYVFATPMWNLGVPAMFKAYLDTANVAGKTFKYTESGPVGLLENKKALHIHASGGIYSTGPAKPFEHSDSYVKSLMNFIGVKEYESIFVEGMALNPNNAEKIKQDSINLALELAKQF